MGTRCLGRRLTYKHDIFCICIHVCVRVCVSTSLSAKAAWRSLQRKDRSKRFSTVCFYV